jgi:hypothetical protein
MDRCMGLSLDVRGVEGVEGGRGRADGSEENDGRRRRGQQAPGPTVHLFALVRVFFFFFFEFFFLRSLDGTGVYA